MAAIATGGRRPISSPATWPSNCWPAPGSCCGGSQLHDRVVVGGARRGLPLASYPATRISNGGPSLWRRPAPTAGAYCRPMPGGLASGIPRSHPGNPAFYLSPSGAPAAPDIKGPHSRALTRRLNARRTASAGKALARNPHVALAALVHRCLITNYAPGSGGSAIDIQLHLSGTRGVEPVLCLARYGSCRDAVAGDRGRGFRVVALHAAGHARDVGTSGGYTRATNRRRRARIRRAFEQSGI